MQFDTGASGSGAPPPPSTGRGMSGGSEFDLSNPVGSFVSTVRGVVLNPVGFFRGMQKSGNFLNPLVFAVICAFIGGALSGIISFLIGLVAGDVGTAFGGLFGGIILTPIFHVIGLFVGAGILHLLVLLLVRPQNAGFEATFRVLAYLSFTYLVAWLSSVPILGILVGLAVAVYTVVLAVIGIREVHSTTTGRAAAVVLIPTAVLLLLAIIFGIAVAALIFAGQSGSF